ncbi:MAG: PTS mannitol transporter subunit IIABC [Chloroflexi bacterium]|nr:PTS mannitol transporter subunit IIABC [Chloroflexota bacterium]
MRMLFVTGKLAAPALEGVLREMEPPFAYEIAVQRITVAALMTTTWIADRLTVPPETDLIVIPGLCEGDPQTIAERTGVRVEKGPRDLKDIPDRFGGQARPADYAQDGEHSVTIFAEINSAPYLSTEEIVNLAEYYRASGADVVDLGCSLDRRFENVAEVVGLLKGRGFTLSIDTFDKDEIRRADAAGVDYLLSINGTNLDLAPALRCTPVVIPDFGQGLDSLAANVEQLEALGRRYIVDPIVEPLNFGFAESLMRYVEARRRWPHAEMLMGIGNITEMTDADSTGVNALLMGFVQELGITHVLTTEVAHWCRGAVREVDIARRLMHYAHRRAMVPKNLDDRLLTLKDRKPSRAVESELRDLHRRITDPNFRIFTDGEDLYAFNAHVFVKGTDVQEMFERLGVDEPSHAFYLGMELTKAALARQLGKSYYQDQPLRWGYQTIEEDRSAHARRVRLTQRARRPMPEQA